MVRLILQISRGIIRDQRTRRIVMFYGVLAALVVLFAGATFLDDWLRARPFLFLLYWGACAWLTMLAVLMALFDLLVVRARARGERRRLESEYFQRSQNDDSRPH